MSKSHITIIIILLLLLSPTGSKSKLFVTYNEITKLTAEQSLQIALEIDEIISWFSNHTLESSNAIFWDGLWEVQLSTFNQTLNVFIKVIINDKTSQIISISYSKIEDPFEDDDLISSAYQYFLSTNDSDYMFNYHFESYSNSYARNNLVQFSGVNNSHYNSNRAYFYTTIGFNLSVDGTYDFHVVKTRSNRFFGNGDYNFSRVSDILDNNNDVRTFQDTYTSNYVQFELLQYYSSPYHTEGSNYQYEIQSLFNEDIEYVEYNNGNYSYSYSRLQESLHLEFMNPILVGGYIFLDIIIDAITGEITYLDGSFLRKNSYIKLIEIALADMEINDWLSRLWRFEGEIKYIYNNLFKLTLSSPISISYAEIILNDSSSSIANKTLTFSNPPRLTSESVKDLVMQDPEYLHWSKYIPIVSDYIFYDTTSTWYIEFYDPVIANNYAKFSVDDLTGNILQIETVEINSLINFNHEDVINLVFSYGMGNFYYDFPDSQLLFYYHDNAYWSVFIFSKYFPANYLFLQFEDQTGQIVRSYRSNARDKAGVVPDISSLGSIFRSNHKVNEFLNEFKDSYEFIYFKDEWNFHIDTVHSQFVFESIDAQLMEDMNIGNLESNLLILEQPLIFKNEDAQSYFNSEKEYYNLGKLYSIPMESLKNKISDPSFLNNQIEGDSRSNLLIVSVISITVLIVFILIRGRRQIE